MNQKQSSADIARDIAVESELGNVVKGDFIASLDHLLRNPMNSVLGMLNLMRDSDLDENQRRYVDSALEAAGYLMKTIQAITEFPLDSTEMAMKQAPFDLFKAGKNVIQALSGTAAAKNVFLRFEYEADTPTIFIGDSNVLQQVLAKVLECAIRETDKGTVALDISASSSPGDEVLIQIALSSTSAELSKAPIFSSFDFAEPGLSPEYRRAKLELAVCRRIIEKMGGRFNLPPVGGGDSTSVLLEIPFREPRKSRLDKLAEERVAPEPSKTASFKQTFNGISVLLAEDDPINQSLAVAFLSKLGGVVETADNGRIALDKFRSNDYDIVLLDCEMPEMNGFEAARSIREFEKETGREKRVPIIAMTAYAARGDRENCLAAGMDDHVPKPITLDSLAAIAERHIFQNR